jgi:hypothetical protein
LYDNVRALLLLILSQAADSKLAKKHGFFDLLGCDFMLNADNNLYLLEINTNPALSLGKFLPGTYTADDAELLNKALSVVCCCSLLLQRGD